MSAPPSPFLTPSGDRFEERGRSDVRTPRGTTKRPGSLSVERICAKKAATPVRRKKQSAAAGAGPSTSAATQGAATSGATTPPPPSPAAAGANADADAERVPTPASAGATSTADDPPAPTGEGEEEEDNDGFTVVSRRRRPPPIFVYGVADIFGLLEALQTTCGEREVTAEVAGDAVRIRCEGHRGFQDVLAALDERSVEYHTYSTGNEKFLRYVLRGIPLELSFDALHSNLEHLGFQVRKLERICSQRPGRRGRPLPLIIATLQDTQRHRALREVTSIRGLRVRVEVYRPPRGPTQCHNCLDFGHVARNCKRRTRCKFCGNAHGAEQCPLGQNPPAEERNCSNCQGDHHGAKYKGCPEYKRRCFRGNAAQQQRHERQQRDRRRRAGIQERRAADARSEASRSPSRERTPSRRRSASPPPQPPPQPPRSQRRGHQREQRPQRRQEHSYAHAAAPRPRQQRERPPTAADAAREERAAQVEQRRRTAEATPVPTSLSEQERVLSRTIDELARNGLDLVRVTQALMRAVSGRDPAEWPAII